MVQTSTRGENYCVLRMLKILCVLLKVIILTRAIGGFGVLPHHQIKSFLHKIPSIKKIDFQGISPIQQNIASHNKKIASIQPQMISSLKVNNNLLPNINNIGYDDIHHNYVKPGQYKNEKIKNGWNNGIVDRIVGNKNMDGIRTAGDRLSSVRTSVYGTHNYGTIDDGMNGIGHGRRRKCPFCPPPRADVYDNGIKGTGAATEPTESVTTRKAVLDWSGGNVNGNDGIGGDGIIRKNQKYPFRVHDENDYGLKVWSESSTIVGLTESTIRSTNTDTNTSYYTIFGILVFVVIIVAITAFVSDLYCCNKSPIVNKTPSVNSEPKNHDLNLQSDLNEFQRIKIKRKQMTLGKLIGLGNFGEVYQGTVEILEISKTVLVAIKMLREDATAQQKNEFLKEAKIMAHFDHIHVLRLLGICNETMDSPWLILELMEAGDLLTYLRESRTLQPSDPQALRLKDLLAMCEDVARGCRYLEEQHYVHRDLACRNCLISARDREHRIVKIRDFGLARDIYEKDYHRMGKGIPLPVRWMAPESLKEKKFSSQSDVWAFGVLMWEITSLGQQPYADIDNCNVKRHVCAGNKLLKPRHCPEKLYNLMLSCWNIANDRPNFKSCLDTIETLKNEIEDTILHLLPPSEISEYDWVEILPEAQPTVLLNV